MIKSRTSYRMIKSYSRIIEQNRRTRMQSMPGDKNCKKRLIN